MLPLRPEVVYRKNDSTSDRLHEEFFQFASCKSEDTYAEQNLFTVPNYDFSGIFSRDNFVIFRARRPEDTRDYAERGTVREAFDDLLLEFRPTPESTILSSNEEIVKATLEGSPGGATSRGFPLS